MKIHYQQYVDYYIYIFTARVENGIKSWIRYDVLLYSFKKSFSSAAVLNKTRLEG